MIETGTDVISEFGRGNFHFTGNMVNYGNSPSHHFDERGDHPLEILLKLSGISMKLSRNKLWDKVFDELFQMILMPVCWDAHKIA